MIMHIWMHWFWITTSYFKGFLFFTAQTISFSCISHPFIAEAGLLENQTFTSIAPKYYEGNESSQLEVGDPNGSSPTAINERNRTSETTPRQLPSPREETATVPPTTTPQNEDSPRTAGDVEDTYNGGTLDVFQYPLKKFVKYSHLKYGKVKTKGKPNDETGGEERRLESLKVVEENVDANVSTKGGGVGRLETEVDKANECLFEGSTPALPTSDALDPITDPPFVNVTAGGEGLGSGPGGSPGASSNSSAEGVSGVPPPPPGGDRKEVQIPKNETLTIENKVEESVGHTTVEPFAVKNRVAASTSAQNYEARQSELNVGSITGITLGILVVFSLFGAVSFVLYRRRYLNKPQVLHDKCSNLDSSGYIDETSLRENSEEMYSLDNDSFLNSLEAMTIQNYWTESVKHTKL